METVNSENGIVRTAGLTYIIIIIIGVFNAVFIDSRLIIKEDINLTINNISANLFLFRFGITCELILYAAVIVLSVSLYLILKRVNRNIALLAMLFRSGEALLGITTGLIGFIALGILNNQVNMALIENENMVGALLSTRSNGLYIILFLVGLGGTLFLYLLYKSFYIPRILSGWGIFTYLSMLILSLLGILLPDHPELLEVMLYGSGTLFELTIGSWFLFKGINVKQI